MNSKKILSKSTNKPSEGKMKTSQQNVTRDPLIEAMYRDSTAHSIAVYGGNIPNF